jgi:hypothetical protein
MSPSDVLKVFQSAADGSVLEGDVAVAAAAGELVLGAAAGGGAQAASVAAQNAANTAADDRMRCTASSPKDKICCLIVRF